MIKIKNKSKCSGCHACINSCPKKCISMQPDDEGFLYPVVDKDKCINCGLCKKVCHVLNPLENNNSPDAYACYNLNEDIRISSSSGGIFTLIAEWIIEQGGVVFGASFDDNLVVKHFCIDNKEDLYKLRGSKYVQSVIGNTYSQVKEILKNGRSVLFTGTPCQISGLMLFLGKSYDNLYTQDIICHGVPSPKVWELYLRYQERLLNSEVNKEIFPSFRSKEHGWLNFSVEMHFKSDVEYCVPHDNDSFMKAFLTNLSLRPSCYKCKCKGVHRNSDITLADFWGVNRLMPDMFDNKGTSLVLTNTEKGRRLFDEIQRCTSYTEIDIKSGLRFNPMAYSPSPRPLKRKQFIKNINDYNFKELQEICSKKSFPEKACHKLMLKFRKFFNKLHS